MRVLTLGTEVSLLAAAAGATATSGSTPFLLGRENILVTNVVGNTGATVVIETSPDGVTWTTIATPGAGLTLSEAVMDMQIRLNVTVAGTAGTIDAYVLGGV